jgi:hypothetical protein
MGGTPRPARITPQTTLSDYVAGETTVIIEPQFDPNLQLVFWGE